MSLAILNSSVSIGWSLRSGLVTPGAGKEVAYARVRLASHHGACFRQNRADPDLFSRGSTCFVSQEAPRRGRLSKMETIRPVVCPSLNLVEQNKTLGLLWGKL